MSMRNFSEGFSSGMNYLKRRFSSNDLQGEIDSAPDSTGFNFNLPRKGPSPSAPSSPSKSGGMQGFTRSLFGAGAGVGQRASYNKDRCKILMVIDTPAVDWGKYFRGKKLFGDWDIRVEQAEFSEINLASYSESGTVVDIQVTRNGTRVVRSFKPDFVLVRQRVKDANEDWKNIIIGLEYGGIPSVNSLNSVYNFLDKPWVFAHLVQIQQRLGREKFPLIDQSYYPNHREMLVTPKCPVVVKIGHAHGGMGTVKVENHYDYQDISSVVAISRCYCSTESYVDSKYDLHIQKIGNNYKAFMRTSISGNWKVNTGSSMLEQVQLTERFKFWVDECSQLFGGLDVLAVQAVMGKDGREYILEISDSSMTLLGETQEEDRRLIADLVLSKMETHCRPVPTTMSKATSAGAITHYATGDQQAEFSRSGAGSQVSSRPMAGPPGPSPHKTPSENMVQRQTSATERLSNQAPPSPASASVTGQKPAAGGPTSQATVDAVARDLEDSEDTMKNLRKTFAGIFGDM